MNTQRPKKLSPRLRLGKVIPQQRISEPDQAHQYILNAFNKKTLAYTEEVLMLCLNSANQVLGYAQISSGGFSSSLVDPRVVFSIALTACASSIILAHNHPSGETKPSAEDRRITERIQAGGALVGVTLLDHLIVTPSGEYFSFRQEGLLTN